MGEQLFDILAIIMSSAFVLLFFYYFAVLLPFVLQMKSCDKSANQEAISIIVCARNEEERLIKNIPKILQQDYSKFQLVLVDDCSVDGTWEVMKAFEGQDKRVKLVRVNENDQFYTSKKYALTLGIKAADNDLLVFTDADCYPNSNTWLRKMNSCATDSTSIVLAYGDYEKAPGILNALIRFDTALIASQYASFARQGVVYMGVGRNMAYRKSLFLNSKGFSKHQHIDSGDDDLFIGHVANGKNTRINMSAEAKTWSEAKSTLLDWVRQKGRHLTTFKHYDLKNLVAVGLLNSSQAVSLTTAFILLLSPYYLLSIVLLTIKGVSLSLIMLPLRKEHKLPYFILIPLFWELILYSLYPIFFISSKVYKRGTWKI